VGRRVSRRLFCSVGKGITRLSDSKGTLNNDFSNSKNNTKKELTKRSIANKDLNKEIILYSGSMSMSIFDKLSAFKIDKCGKYINITKDFLSDPMFLKFAYYLIRNAKGAHNEFDGINDNWFNKTAQLLKDSQYLFKPARQVEIPKPHKVGIRTITITNGRDRIIQKAIAIILELIYERDGFFQEESHGFRPGKSCHTALKSIKFG